MNGQEPYLKRLLDMLGISQSELARQLGTNRQQISKWAAEGRRISPDWAKRMEPIIGVPWTMLVESAFPSELEPADGDAQLIHKQLLLVREAWPLLTFDERAALVAAISALSSPRRKPA